MIFALEFMPADPYLVRTRPNETSAQEGLEGLHEVGLDELARDEELAGELLRSYREESPQRPDAAHRLTPRQREVLQLSAEGRSAKEVASLLHISPRTAELHRARVMKVLGARTTAELVQYAILNGIISV